MLIGQYVFAGVMALMGVITIYGLIKKRKI